MITVFTPSSLQWAELLAILTKDEIAKAGATEPTVATDNSVEWHKPPAEKIKESRKNDEEMLLATLSDIQRLEDSNVRDCKTIKHLQDEISERANLFLKLNHEKQALINKLAVF